LAEGGPYVQPSKGVLNLFQQQCPVSHATYLPVNKETGLEDPTIPDRWWWFLEQEDKDKRWIKNSIWDCRFIAQLLYGSNSTGGANLSKTIIHTDGDSTPDYLDNCKLTANNQSDSDGDGYGNACDADLNNDCKVDSLDLEKFKLNYGKYGNLASDFNTDLITNSLDLGLFKLMYGKTPGPSDLGHCN
jgi:hypothetical protein